MFYVPSITNSLEILSEEKVKDFIVKNFAECFKPTKVKYYIIKLYSKLDKEKIINKKLSQKQKL